MRVSKGKGLAMDALIRFSFALLLIAGTACSTANDPYVESAAIGGVSGTLVGAGTGAAIGAMISNGDIAASALLGAGIGLPVGILAGIAYQNYTEESQLEENNRIIAQNFEYIKAREEKLLSMREEVLSDFQTIEADTGYRDYYYTGATLGGY